MSPLRLSLLAIACQSVLFPIYVHAQTPIPSPEIIAPASSDSSSASDSEHYDRMTVYGRQNQVVMNSGLATKSDMSLMETPAAVVIVDETLIDSQGITNMQDLVRNISGVTQAGNNYGIGDNIVVRGLGANYTYDGMYGGAGLGNTFNPTRSLTNVSSVEVLKGPATGLYGMGSAGGVINLIEKKPEFVSKQLFEAEVGQWDTYSLMADSTGGITDDLAYRLVAKTAHSTGYRDLGTDRDEIYGSLKYVLNENQNIMLSTAYINDAIPVDSIGHPIRIYNAASVEGKTAGEVNWQDLINDPTNNGLQLTDQQRQQLADSLSANDGLTPYQFGHNGLISPMAKDNKGEELRFKLSHNVYLTDNLFLNQQLQHRDYETSFARQTGAYNYVYWRRNGVINADPRAYFADLRYDFDIGNISNELLVNANFEDRDIRFKQYSIYDADYTLKDANGNQSYQGSLPYIYDIRNPNWGEGEFEEYDPLLTSITYNLGLTYMPTDDISVFINHSKGRTTYSVLGDVKGNEADRDDSQSISNDLGIRIKAFDDQLLASLVLFKTSRTNVAYSNPDYDSSAVTPNIDPYFYNGSEDTKGVELDLNAYLSEQWKVNVNAVYQDARDNQNPNSNDYGQRQKGIPYVTAGAWVTYAAALGLPAPLSLSLGAKYVDERSTQSSSFGIPDGYVPSYSVIDSAISYDVERYKIQLNINNLFNQTYFDKAMFLGGLPGEERNAKLTLTYRI